ncbi:hypothetical protein AMJ39_09830 [candidate division TA06 bacterium DG_24]|uniref:Uncharacterized protein n=2 Tax=Bacteria division TA06 TaxID=1156500 RepID=A0A0S8JIE1_UNCT6|nr:MAG: hypothetical protein AMJ39_09830 [candidate division TA06 bacterium DG_24]KPL09479.1 MAG: hypothetical protein AMJ71_06300 [candidate division TA06 bacterium SM1_40]
MTDIPARGAEIHQIDRAPRPKCGAAIEVEHCARTGARQSRWIAAVGLGRGIRGGAAQSDWGTAVEVEHRVRNGARQSRWSTALGTEQGS